MSSFRVSFHLPCAAFWATALWPTAFLLMIAGSFQHSGHLGRWAILLGLAAATCTAQWIVCHARAVVLDVVSWEHRLTRGDVPDPEPTPYLVR